jgi:acetolactate synthase-1/2/3 large subunit
MNGARALLETLVASGVDVCFSNPGTSEMHFVAALDEVPSMRAVLGLHETVVTGAADGYARMADRPAATLLHLGPGLANGLANLHNARRARTGVLNVIGDHASYHQKLDAPLESSIELLTGWTTGPTFRPAGSADVQVETRRAVQAARAGTISNLILAADASWDEAPDLERIPATGPVSTGVDGAGLEAAAEILRSDRRAMLLLGAGATREPGLVAASRIAAAAGATVLVETFPARLECGAGLPHFERLAYLAESAVMQLAEVDELVLVGAASPVSFFAYPDKPSHPVAERTTVSRLARDESSAVATLLALADLVAPDRAATTAAQVIPEVAPGPLTIDNWVAVVAALLPEGAIVSDEANTSGIFLPAALAGAARHDLLTLTGGAIGQGMPVATGAAVAAPDRPVINLQADGSALYSITSLWTQAREQLDVTTVILNNQAYAILRMELQRVGASAAGSAANRLLDLSGPAIDFVSIAEGFGVPATRASTTDELAAQLAAALNSPGPHLIDAAIPPLL